MAHYDGMVEAHENGKIAQLEAENAQLKAELGQARADYEAASHLAAITSQSWKARGAELAQAKAREARLLEALKSIGQIRFLLGNDPRLNPAYEMGDIAQQAVEEEGT